MGVGRGGSFGGGGFGLLCRTSLLSRRRRDDGVVIAGVSGEGDDVLEGVVDLTILGFEAVGVVPAEGEERRSAKRRERDGREERTNSPSFTSRPRTVVHDFSNSVGLLAVAGGRAVGRRLRREGDVDEKEKDAFSSRDLSIEAMERR